ncbi:MAG: ATP phosphoribosyltransferase [Candidatus Kariarchaeaceae archaeon]|jgi:ATP phosphoribosyltransferase
MANDEEIIRFGIPSKGRMHDAVVEFLDHCGLRIRRKSRNYLAALDGFPNVQIVLQRQNDIVAGVEQGLLTFGIVGYDLSQEIPHDPSNLVLIHEGLGFGRCSLEIAVPEDMRVDSLDDLKSFDGVMRVATGFPNITSKFFSEHGISYTIVEGAGTLEVSPALGNADIIVDLVSTGSTLAANRLRTIQRGNILDSEGVIIGNRKALDNPEVLKIAKRLLEYIEATLRADRYFSIHANMRGSNAEEKVNLLFNKPGLEGLNGPTVSRIINKDEEKWFAIHVVVSKENLMDSIESLRDVGGSGVVVTPTKYIFEEELEAYQALLQRLD